MDGRRRILLVDDDERVLFVLQATLRRLSAPLDIITARDGLEAYRLLEDGAFDLLVTDVRLPGIDGVSLTRAARSTAPAMPVVWITAHGCAAIRADALLLGVHRCVEKPVEMDEFRQVVRQALAASEESESL